MVKLDKTDRLMLSELMKDSRIPVTQLARRLRVSREVANYRLGRLKAEGVILDFVTEISTRELGFIGAAVFINVKATRQKEFKEFLKSCPFVSWVAELSGVWSFGLSILGKSNEELGRKFSLIHAEFKGDIIDHRFTLHRCSKFFYEKYFGSVPRPQKPKRLVECRIDTTDKFILKEMSLNSRIGSVDLAKKVSLTAPAVSQRIKKLKAGGFIKRYSLFVDISKLGLCQYSIFVVNKDMNERARLVSYLQNHPNVSFLAEYVGDEFLEFGLFVENPYLLREKLQEIEEQFPDNRVIEVSLFQKEFVSVGPPRCVFE